MAEGWSDSEIHATVDVYFQMLTLELAGQQYTKAEFRRSVERTVIRSPKAIEYKFSNVSAVLDDLGAVWIPGYKPLRNVQDRLRVVVRERFEDDAELRSFMLTAVEESTVQMVPLGREVEPPTVDWGQAGFRGMAVKGVDFSAVEAANSALGLAGEKSVVAAERMRLVEAGRDDLAAEVRHVSVVDGDGLGYDVRSFMGFTDHPLYIEVKTTRYAKEVPFHLTSNELEASNEFGPSYRLWRNYRYEKPDTGYYKLSGPLQDHSVLRPDTYRGLPRAQ